MNSIMGEVPAQLMYGILVALVVSKIAKFIKTSLNKILIDQFFFY